MDNGDLRAAWPGTHPTLRLVLAQDWVWSHRHSSMIGHEQDWDGQKLDVPRLDAIATGLAECPSSHDLWPPFSNELIQRWNTIWKGFSARTWAPCDEPEVVGLDAEMVTFMEYNGRPSRFVAGRSDFVRRFAMHHEGGNWLVASVNGDQMFRPGWPPVVE